MLEFFVGLLVLAIACIPIYFMGRWLILPFGRFIDDASPKTAAPRVAFVITVLALLSAGVFIGALCRVIHTLGSFTMGLL